jgi:hypothetical protein
MCLNAARVASIVHKLIALIPPRDLPIAKGLR